MSSPFTNINLHHHNISVTASEAERTFQFTNTIIYTIYLSLVFIEIYSRSTTLSSIVNYCLHGTINMKVSTSLSFIFVIKINVKFLVIFQQDHITYSHLG